MNFKISQIKLENILMLKSKIVGLDVQQDDGRMANSTQCSGHNKIVPNYNLMV